MTAARTRSLTRPIESTVRLRLLSEAWIAPPACRELRELVRYRAKLVCLRSGLGDCRAILREDARVIGADRKQWWGAGLIGSEPQNASTSSCASSTRKAPARNAG